MKILITFAVESEFTPWRRLRRFRRSLADGNPVYGTEIGESELRIFFTGIGPHPAARMISGVLGDLPNVCITTGLAGGLKPEHRPGEILAARAVRAAEGNSVIRSDGSLFELAVACGAKAAEMFQTSGTIVQSAEDKFHMGARADAVEMESFTIMSRMSASGVPAVAIRAIGDPVDENLPFDFNQVLDEEGRVSMPLMFTCLVKDVHRLPALMRFGLESRRAAVSLVRFLDRYVEALVSQKRPSEVLSHLAVG